MISKLPKYFSFVSILTALLCSCSGNENSKKDNSTITVIDSLGSDKGSLMYKNYCLTCHGYTKSGTYYQPSLDSMYSLLEKNKLNFTYSIKSHEVLIPKKDSINFENIRSYMKQKYHSW